jgi:hypothetical protein
MTYVLTIVTVHVPLLENVMRATFQKSFALQLPVDAPVSARDVYVATGVVELPQ